MACLVFSWHLVKLEEVEEVKVGEMEVEGARA
jgi:hypothetical protein